MEYAKDNISRIKYKMRLNRLQIEDERWASKLLKKIQHHKLLTTIVIAFVMFSTLNIVMIYNFMKILQNI